MPPSLREPLNLRLPLAPLAVPPVTWARPVNVTVTGPLSPLLQPLDLDSTTFRLSLAAAPAMVPVPVKGSHCAEEDEVPLPLIVLAPTRVPVPLPVTDEIVTAPLSMSRAALPL